MTKFFKNSALIVVLFCLNVTYSQNKEIDSLLQKIDNKDAYIVLTQTISPRVKGNNANRIIEIGKTASPELIKILDSQNKGIIAHFMLSAIWETIWDEEACCNLRNVGGIEILTINGLEIQIENNVLYSTTENLKKIQQVWKKNCHA